MTKALNLKNFWILLSRCKFGAIAFVSWLICVSTKSGPFFYFCYIKFMFFKLPRPLERILHHNNIATPRGDLDQHDNDTVEGHIQVSDQLQLVLVSPKIGLAVARS